MRVPRLPVCKYMVAQAAKTKGDWFSPVLLLFFFEQEKSQLECCSVVRNQPQNPSPLLGRAVSAHFHQRKHLSAFPSLLLLLVSLCCCLKFRAQNKAGRHPQAARNLLSSPKGCQSFHRHSLGGGHANHPQGHTGSEESNQLV